MAKSPIKLKVASPCAANWSEMKGDDAVRHCSACDQNVYQLSNMSSEQVEEFLLSRRRRGLRTCVRFYQRNDGTLMTSDCSVGKQRKRKKQMLSVFGAAAVSASAVGLSMGTQSDSAKSTPDQAITPIVQEHITTGKPMEPAEVVPKPPVPVPELVQGGLVEEPIEMLGEYVESEPEPEPGQESDSEAR